MSLSVLTQDIGNRLTEPIRHKLSMYLVLDKEGEGVTVKDGTLLSLGLTNSPPPESTATKFRKKGLLKDTIGQPNSQMWLTSKGVLVHPVKAKRGIGKNASAGQWTRGMDCCWQTWNHWVLTSWKTQQQKLT